MKDVLIVYFTRTGNSENLAEQVGVKLHGEIDEIKSKVKYHGTFGFIRAGYRSVTNKVDEIDFQKDPSEYKILVIVSPIWASNIPSPIRAYIEENRKKIDKFGLIINGSMKENKKAYDNFADVLGNPISEYVADNSNINYEICQKELEDFSDKIRFELEKEEENE